jgi:outer membrane protein assembly factor BamB
MIPISPVLGSDGTIYVLAAGKLVELSPAGETVQEVPLAADAVVSPTLAPDGTLYIATDNRSLYAVETTSKGLTNSPWPKYQRDLSNSGSSF